MINIISIDTSSNKEIIVKIKVDGRDYVKKSKIDKNKAQVALPMIDKILKVRKLKLNDINKIEVAGKGNSFTGIRVGMAIAQTISYALKIPLDVSK